MAFLDSIKHLFFAPDLSVREVIVPAPQAEYSVLPLTYKQQSEVLRLNSRCFDNGDNYTKNTFAYLLSEPRTLSYRMVTPTGNIVGFIFVMVKESNSAHLTTIGVAPEHRRRGIAEKLLVHAEQALLERDVNTVMLEVRVSNVGAQQLYRRCGFHVVQRISRYYNNGEDCFLMMKPLWNI
jgi:[ribosomal protein S18]-alanine N-acetyltransferase